MDIEQISADGIPLNLVDTQARTDITEIKSNLTDLNSLTLPFSDEAPLSLTSCTGTLGNGLKYALKGDTLAICGNVTISNITRTSSNPGVTFTLPNNRKIYSENAMNINFNFSSYMDTFRIGETTRFQFTQGESDKFYIRVSEGSSNVQTGKTLLLIVPLTYLHLVPVS